MLQHPDTVSGSALPASGFRRGFFWCPDVLLWPSAAEAQCRRSAHAGFGLRSGTGAGRLAEGSPSCAQRLPAAAPLRRGTGGRGSRAELGADFSCPAAAQLLLRLPGAAREEMGCGGFLAPGTGSRQQSGPGQGSPGAPCSVCCFTSRTRPCHSSLAENSWTGP